jgi:ABC-type sugar transport system substrate-binding protein
VDNVSLAGRRAARYAAIAAACLVTAVAVPAAAQDPSAEAYPSKLSEFGPFVASDAVGAKPDLPRSIAFMVPDSGIQYYADIGAAIEAGARDAGVEYQIVSAAGDPVKNIDQINQVLQRGVGCLVVQPIDTAAQAPVLQQAIDQGVYVDFFVTPPANTQTMADQFDLGYQQGKAAVEWIDENLGGTAVVANMSADQIAEALIPRRLGTEAALAEGGDGIELIDIPILHATPDEGFKKASEWMQVRPDINVWIGPDQDILQVNAYLESVGKSPETDMIYLTGLNGDSGNLDAVAAGDTFIQSSWAFQNSVQGYAMGQLCGRWLDGLNVPQVLQVKGTNLTTAEEVSEYQKIIGDPSAQYPLLVEGTQGGNAFWGDTSFENKDDYVRTIVVGG